MNLVDAITPTAAEYTMLTTFPFDARFYSEYLSREFSDAGVASPVILMDQDRYQRNFHEGTWQPGSIGGSYYLEPIDVGQVFHPKVAVSTSEDTIDVAVSSANLTLDELTSAAQLGMEYTLTRDDADDDPHTPVIQDILSFVDELQEEYVGRDAGTQLSRLVEQGSWIHDVSATNETTQFLQNLTTPILPQIVETLDAVDRVQLAAPFFGSAETMQRIVAQIDPVECELLIDEGTTHIDLEAVIDAIDRPVTIRQLDYAASRWIHAKWIGFQGTDWSGCFYGSPNMTGSALLSSASTGNLEAGLLRIESNPAYFDDGPPLFNTEQFDVSLTGAVDADTVTTNSYANLDTSTNESAVDLQLQDIFIQSESEDTANLELTLDAPTPASLREQTATLTTLTADDRAVVSWTDPSEESEPTDLESIRGTASVPATWRNAIVRVELSDGRVSTYRQVTAEPTPYTRSQHEMLNSGGREGVQDLIWNLIFRGDARAGQSLSDSATDIQRRLAESDDGGSQITNDESGSNWTIGGSRSGGRSQRAPHLQLKDSLELSKTNLEHFVNQSPDPDYVQEVLDHLENYWTTIEAGYVRRFISDQLPTDRDVELQFNPDDLGAIAQQYFRVLHSEQLLERVGTYLTAGLRKASGDHATYIDGEQAFECLFAHPALLLAFDIEMEEHAIPPFYFAKAVFRTLSCSQPIVAGRLLDPTEVADRYMTVVDRYRDGLDQLESTYECDLNLPARANDSYKTLLYTIWYQELATHADEPSLFHALGECDRYGNEMLEALGGMLLEGRDHLDAYEGLSEFTDGSLNAIAQKMLGDGSSAAGSREQEIEKLDQGTYWSDRT